MGIVCSFSVTEKCSFLPFEMKISLKKRQEWRRRKKVYTFWIKYCIEVRGIARNIMCGNDYEDDDVGETKKSSAVQNLRPQLRQMNSMNSPYVTNGFEGD